jgi:hypothetical protein
MFLSRKVPRYWIEDKTIVCTTIFTILFSILFLLIYGPFSSTSWLSLIKKHQPNYYQIVLASISFYLVAISILALSKFLMHSIQRKHPFSIGNLLLWTLAEASAISIIYTLFTELFIIPDPQLFLPILGRSFVVLLFILFIPYIISILFTTTVHQRKLLNRLARRKNNQTARTEATDSKLLQLIDNTGKLKMSVSIDALYYIESQDNYVKVYYESEGKICTYMLRSTTKAIEDQFKDYFVRCHRSYIVNKHKIMLFNGDRGNMYLKLNHESIQPIPVSRTYTSNIQEILTPVHS